MSDDDGGRSSGKERSRLDAAVKSWEIPTEFYPLEMGPASFRQITMIFI